MQRLTLYSKPDCHLCEQLKEDLADLLQEVTFSLHELNIEHHPDSYERFRYLIPVLELADGTLLYPPHVIQQIRSRLLALSGDPKC